MPDDLESVALRRLLFNISGADAEEDNIVDAANGAIERMQRLEEENEQLRQRVVALENQLDTIQDLGSKKTSKEEKVAQLVTYADNRRGGRDDRVSLSVGEIQGIADISRRYSYRLLDDLPEEYDWLLDRSDVTQYGDLEIDKDGQDRALVVDFEQLHNDEGAVNKFITTTTSEEGSA